MSTPAPSTFSVDNGYHVFTDDELATMERMKDRMKDFPHIHFQTDNMFLAKYLRAFDWNIDQSLERMQIVYKFRKDHPDWFAVKRASEYMPKLNEHQRYVLNGRDKHGRRIFVYRLGNTRKDTTLQDVAQLDDMWYECMLTEHETQLNGVVVLIDCLDLPWCCLKWCQPKLIRIGAEKSDLLPLKNLEIHLINQSTLMNTISQAVRPWLSKELLAKFHFHKNNWDVLHEFVGRECLPEEYGGPAGSRVDYEFGVKYLLKYEEFIFANRQYGLINKTNS